MKVLDSVLQGLLAALIAAMTIIAFGQVVTRYVFFQPWSWSEELTRYMMVWMTLLGAAYGVRIRAHVGIDVLQQFGVPWLRRAAGIAADLLGLLFGLLLTYASARFVLEQLERGQRSPAMAVPMYAVNFGLLLGGVLLVVYHLAQLASPAPPAGEGEPS